MNAIESFAELLKNYLFDNKSVSVAGLGHFRKEKASASIHPVLNEFSPPGATIFFLENKNCSTSASFLSFIADKKSISDEDARLLSQQFNSDIHNDLILQNNCTIESFGIFRRQYDFSVVFEVSGQILPDIDTFGLPEFTLPHKQTSESVAATQIPVQTTEPETASESVDTPVAEAIPEQHQEPIQTSDTVAQDSVTSTPVAENIPPAQSKRKRKSAVWLILLFIIIAGGSAIYFTGYWEVLYREGRKLVGQDETTRDVPTVTAENQVNDEKQSTEAVIVQDTVSQKTEEEIDVQPVQTVQADATHRYFVVADCFSDLSLAEKRMKDLQSQGYNSTIAGKTKQGLHIVTYGGYSEKSQAEAQLQSVRNSVNKNTWLYSK